MQKLLTALAVGALGALFLPGTAGAQSLNDIPELGPEICNQWQALLDEFEGDAQDAGTPFAEAHGGFQDLHDEACAEGDGDDGDEGDDGGDDGGANPLCDPLEQIAAQAETYPSPGPEFAGGVRSIAEAIGCTGDDGDDNGNGNGDENGDENGDDGTTGDDDDDGTTGGGDTEVAGRTATAPAPDTGGGALPATGGGLLAGGAGLGLVGLAALARRLSGTA